MNKLGIMLLLSCSASLSATDKADFTLKWREEPTSVTDPITRWQVEQKKRLQLRPSYPLTPELQSRQGDIFGRVDKTHRQRFVSPNFSSFNSDESDFGYTPGGLKMHW